MANCKFGTLTAIDRRCTYFTENVAGALPFLLSHRPVGDLCFVQRIAWLGVLPYVKLIVDLAIDKEQTISNMRLALTVGRPLSAEDLTSILYALPNPASPICIGIGNFLGRPWFMLLWVMQEVIVPRHR